MRHFHSLSLATLLLCLAVPALAQEKPQAGRSARDQHYVFEDDPLDAVGPSDRGVRVRSRPTPGRVTLIRPRTHFVRELTRAVENL